MTKIKNVAYKLHENILKRDIKNIKEIDAALKQMLEVDFDPQEAVSKLHSYIAAFQTNLESGEKDKDSIRIRASWKALCAAISSIMGDDVDQWRWYDKFENYMVSATSLLVFEAEQEAQKETLEKQKKAVEDAFASLGL
jgi:hypothetical protein